MSEKAHFGGFRDVCNPDEKPCVEGVMTYLLYQDSKPCLGCGMAITTKGSDERKQRRRYDIAR